MATMVLKNCRLLSGGEEVAGAAVVFEDGKIKDVVKNGGNASGGMVYDLDGCIITPGLCDIHIHGAGGHWGFSENVGDILSMARALARFGVTSFLPTTVSLPEKETLKAVASVREAMRMQPGADDFSASTGEDGGARILGINLEGPFLSREKPGAHFPAFIRGITREEIDEILEAGDGKIRVVTIAPEIEGAMDAIEYLSSRGVVVSIGHTNCTADTAREAVARGARLFTHLFNAMRPIHQREPGVVVAAVMSDACFEIIPDGIHVHPMLFPLVIGAKAKEKVILITDSILAAGIEEKIFKMFGFDAAIVDGVAKLPDGTIAGSILTLNRGVKNMSEFCGIQFETAVMMATLNPMRLLGLDGLAGRVAPGMAADLAVFNPDFDCLASFIGGVPVHGADFLKTKKD